VAQHQWGDRNLAEQATIFALAYRAGLANREGGRFGVVPADMALDQNRGTDLLLFRNSWCLRVDVTDSHAFTPSKIRRAVKFAKRGQRWVFILRVDWMEASAIAIDPCFTRAYGEFVQNKDGHRLALEQACPEHGNECALARKLFQFGQAINYKLVSSLTQAHDFAIPVSKPPF